MVDARLAARLGVRVLLEDGDGSSGSKEYVACVEGGFVKEGEVKGGVQSVFEV